MSPTPEERAPWRPMKLNVHVSTVLLLLAAVGMLLRLTAAAAWLLKLSPLLGLVLAVLAPLWALSACLAASVYLMLSMVRPYNVVQFLAEMALGVLLMVLMLPIV